MEQIRGLQGLRGIAACAVVWSHSYARAERTWISEIGRSSIDAHPAIVQIGHFGVDLFFVLSGFLMTHLHRQDFGRSDVPREFLRRRITRIVPLYWLLSVGGLLALALAPALFSYHKAIEWGWMVGCFVFIPWPMSDGFSSPIIGTGWTLDYEMYFYVLFALTLLFRSGLRALFIGMCASVFVGLLLKPQHPWAHLLTGPLLLEFVFGVLVALSFQYLSRTMAIISMGIAIPLILAGGSPYASSSHQELTRVWCWGIPCAFLLAGIVRLAPSCRGRIGKSLVILGDASYSIYLFQVFALPVIAIALRYVKVTKVMPTDIGIAILWVMTCAAGVVCWISVEQPLMAFIRRSQNSRQAHAARL